MDPEVIETKQEKKSKNDTYLLFMQPEFLQMIMRKNRRPILSQPPIHLLNLPNGG